MAFICLTKNVIIFVPALPWCWHFVVNWNPYIYWLKRRYTPLLVERKGRNWAFKGVAWWSRHWVENYAVSNSNSSRDKNTRWFYPICPSLDGQSFLIPVLVEVAGTPRWVNRGADLDTAIIKKRGRNWKNVVVVLSTLFVDLLMEEKLKQLDSG